MTIAACYVSSEGVVFGADSTTTLGRRFFDYGQKVFQIGEKSHLGMTMWGLGGLGKISYRTMIAQLSNDLKQNQASSMEKIAKRWSGLFWKEYKTACDAKLERVRELLAKSPRDPDEEVELLCLGQDYSGGFCLGGCCIPDHTPRAFEITFGPWQTAESAPEELAVGDTRFWGCPNLILRVLWGFDLGCFTAILNSGKWTGTKEELAQTLLSQQLLQPHDVPLREAIDWVHAAIYTTIKVMKFSQLEPVCGGPIEIAVVTTDRPFRWVMHKGLDEAVFHDLIRRRSHERD